MHLLASDIDEIVEGLPVSLWERFSGRRVMLTGGRGFLGRYLTAAFVRANETVLRASAPAELLVLDNLITAGPFGEHAQAVPNVSFVKHDITKPFYPERRVDFILHAAGIASPAWYRKYPEETYSVSVKGTENVLEIAKQSPGCRLAFFSSSEIYGDPDAANVPTKESYKGHVSCLGPRACYDEGKRFGEMMVRVAHERHGVSGSMIRPFNFYGPGMQKTDYRVLPNFAARISDGQPLEVYGNGLQTRTFCYVTDGIRGCLQVLLDGRAGEPYNVGNPDPEISMRDLVEKVSRAAAGYRHANCVNYPDTYPADEPQRRCPDISKIVEHTGYRPLVSLDDGLRRFFGWAAEAYREPARAA